MEGEGAWQIYVTIRKSSLTNERFIIIAKTGGLILGEEL